ncbi:phytoene desaturase [Caulobacter sp. UNC358MFTsu5.1]|uniref:phytoene desaturase n=1 Tax=Caulobacter sp. UNC358MFTsu5.1 TaxID=1449049 RepID=UPI0004A6D150|nr:phytoene desaturase [Caulobacter sp. UNC358MFTsu5.1]
MTTTPKPKAAVIGAGFGGLALAVRLQSSGFDVTVFEGREKPGGRAYVWHDEGFTFDAGPTVVTDPDCLKELFELGGRRIEDYVELLPVDPFYRLVWEDGDVFDYVNDQEKLDAQIARRNPADVEGYRRFHAYSEELYQKGYVELGAVPFLDFGSMIASAPALMKLQAWRSVYDKVAGFVKDEHVRQALSFHSLLVGGSPFATSSIYALIHALERRGGVWFPRGGTHALIRALVKLLEDLGGTIHLGQPIRKITTKAGRVTGVIRADGQFEAFDAVASNADVMHTYRRLLADDPRGAKVGKALEAKRWSPSLFVVYFGLKTTHPEIRHHTICFGNRYRELIGEIYGKDGLADDFSLYLHHPTASDPAMAPEGCSAFYALSPVPNLKTANIDWSVEGPKYRDKILAYLEKHYIPGLSADLVTSRFITPDDFVKDLNAWKGAAFSLEPILTQSAFFRTHNRDDVIPNLYFVGAGTHPGAGIPGVVGSAKATAGLMIDDYVVEGETLPA